MPVLQVQGSVVRLLCRCILLQEWDLLCVLLLSPTLAQPWEQRALHNKLGRNKVG